MFQPLTRCVGGRTHPTHTRPTLNRKIVRSLRQTPLRQVGVSSLEPDKDLLNIRAVTDTTSLRSSILKYKYENGRRYHSDAVKDGIYW